MLGRDTDSGNEELGARIDDDANQLVELALRVIITVRRWIVSNWIVIKQMNKRGLSM